MVATPGSARKGRGGYMRGRGRPRGSRSSRSLFGTPSTVTRRNTGTGGGQSTNRFGTAGHQLGDKPREEISYREFHPEFDIDAVLQIYDSREVDGLEAEEQQQQQQNTASSSNVVLVESVVAESSDHGATHGVMTNGVSSSAEGIETMSEVSGHHLLETESQSSSQHDLFDPHQTPTTLTPSRRGRRPKPRTSSVTSQNQPSIYKLSNVHENERLSLPVPSYRSVRPFGMGDTYIDRSMAQVGFQESDFWHRPNALVRNIAISNIDEHSETRLPQAVAIDRGEGTVMEKALGIGQNTSLGMVEYDMDEQDDKWLAAYNAHRRTLEVPPITRELFEITVTKIEKEWYALEKRIPKVVVTTGEPEEEAEDTKCWVCDDGECENSNAIVFCDGCDLAVHQDCYGVPFIPEGQWLCRKCQLLTPRQHANCIFCPNTDGAFKQTTTNRWCHLLCAIWIPEVTLSNLVYMEPVEGVERVPKQRWKLSCYICRQKMGACIQCSNKNCYLAFHATCARRAKLYLQMKPYSMTDPPNPQSGERGTIFDASLLKAFCDKHVPPDWRQENDVDEAILDAQEFYDVTMPDRIWVDSQANAVASPNSPVFSRHDNNPFTNSSTLPRLTLTVGGNKRKRTVNPAIPRIIWRLPSGAPVIPNILYNNLIESLNKFSVRKIKEYVAEICKYWTLKRESRRDASLLKRLQASSQTETFTSDEVTRKKYETMGEKGCTMLQRRLEFAIKLRHDLDRLRLLCDDVKKREREKLKGVECLREMVEAVYFPIIPLLRPILARIHQLDSKDHLRVGLQEVVKKVLNREYNTVKTFDKDLKSAISDTVNKAKLASLNAKLNNVAATNVVDNLVDTLPPLPNGTPRASMKPNLDQTSKTASRILKAIQPMMEDAFLKERDIRQDPYEKLAGEVETRYAEQVEERRRQNEAAQTALLTDSDAMDVDASTAIEGTNSAQTSLALDAAHNDDDDADELEGILGIPWYIRPFEPEGTSLLIEERWSGPDVVRDMSPFSELDEEEINGLTVLDKAVLPGANLDDEDSVTREPQDIDEEVAKPRSRPQRKAKVHWKTALKARTRAAADVRSKGGRAIKNNTKGYAWVEVQEHAEQMKEDLSESGIDTGDAKEEVIGRETIIVNGDIEMEDVEHSMSNMPENISPEPSDNTMEMSLDDVQPGATNRPSSSTSEISSIGNPLEEHMTNMEPQNQATHHVEANSNESTDEVSSLTTPSTFSNVEEADNVLETDATVLDEMMQVEGQLNKEMEEAVSKAAAAAQGQNDDDNILGAGTQGFQPTITSEQSLGETPVGAVGTRLTPGSLRSPDMDSSGMKSTTSATTINAEPESSGKLQQSSSINGVITTFDTPVSDNTKSLPGSPQSSTIAHVALTAGLMTSTRSQPISSTTTPTKSISPSKKRSPVTPVIPNSTATITGKVVFSIGKSSTRRSRAAEALMNNASASSSNIAANINEGTGNGKGKEGEVVKDILVLEGVRKRRPARR